MLEVGELSDISKVKFSKARRNVMREKREKEVVIKKKKKKDKEGDSRGVTGVFKHAEGFCVGERQPILSNGCRGQRQPRWCAAARPWAGEEPCVDR